MSDSELYLGREQTLVKHFILRLYLSRFAHIVGSFASAITYVDCFSGPWNVSSEDFKDSSFAIALHELREARRTLSKAGRDLKLRCFFVEKDQQAYTKLKEFADQATDVEIEAHNCDLKDAIADIVTFARKGGSKSFTFVFIDPTGWSGFAMETIGPLLRLKPGEVLINFMTGHIRRFIESPREETQESFNALFGSKDYKEKMLGLAQQDREDALVRAYAENVKQTGGFPFTCSAIVLHPQIDRTHFHLIYATRDQKGVEVFKGAEKKAMELMERARADAQQRQRVKKTRAMELFPSDVLSQSALYSRLRERYLSEARQLVEKRIRNEGRIGYDALWTIALSRPLVWESDLKSWITDSGKSGTVRVEGMKPTQRVPKRGENNIVVHLGHRDPG